MSDIVKVNSHNYAELTERRDEIEDLIHRASGIVAHLQDMYNDLDESITNYDNEQSALDE